MGINDREIYAMAEVDQKSGIDQFGHKILEQFMNLFVLPEIRRRQDAGELEKPLNLIAAQILFFPDGRKPLVRINSEVKAIGRVELKSGISKKRGDPILESEVDGLGEISRIDGDYPDCGHATFIRIVDRWTIVFDFRYNKDLAQEHVDAAMQFYNAAEFSFNRKHGSSFADNLYSAAELSAKAILLSIAEPKVDTHRAITARFNRFADLGSVKTEHKEAFNRLYGLRDSARYLKRKFTISDDEALKLLKDVKDMIEHSSYLVST